MSRFNFTVIWIRPSLTAVDITERVLEFGKLTKGIGDPGQLFTLLEGDMTITADDEDGFFRSEISAANLRRQNFTVDLVRDSTRLFRGSVLAEDLNFDEDKLTAEFTLLGPTRQLSETSADIIRRNFNPIFLIEQAVGPQDFLRVSDSTADFRPGDLIRVSADRTVDFRVRGFEPAISTLRIDPPLEVNRNLPAGAPIEVLTPFPRNELIADVAENLFVAAGITDTDILVEGGFGARPFSGPFSATGVEDYGLPRGFLYGEDAGVRVVRGVYSQVTPGVFGEAAVRQASSLTSGFVEATTGPVPPPDLSGTIPSNSDHGNFIDPYDNGANPISPLDFSQQFLGRQPEAFVIGGPVSPGYTVQQSRWFGWPTNPVTGAGILFELRFVQTLDPVEVRGPKPDYENGALGWSIRIFKWVTTDHGANWSQSLSFNTIGFFNIASVLGQPPLFDRSQFFMPGAQVGREYMDPERDWSLSGQSDLGFGGVLYATVQTSGFSEPRVIRIPLLSGSDDVDEPAVTTLHFNAGSSRALRLSTGLGGFSTELFWFDTQSNALVLDVETWNGSVFVNASYTSIGIGGNGINLRTLKWNGQSAGGTRVATTFRTLNNGRGVGWIVLRAKDSFGDYKLGVDGFASLAIGRPRVDEEARWLPASSSPRPIDDEFLALWILADDTRLWISFVAGRYVVITNEVTGYVSYYDFEGLSALESLQQMAFVTNAIVKVDTLSDGSVRGTFRPRDNSSPRLTKITDRFGAVPPGEPERLFHAKRTGSWVHTFGFVRIDGAIEDVFATAGDTRLQQDGLQLECRLIESNDLAQVLADTLLEFYGGTALAPTVNFGITTRGLTFGPYDVFYQLVALNSAGDTVALSEIVTELQFNGSVTITWDPGILQPQAVECQIFRIAFGIQNPIDGFWDETGRLDTVPFSNGAFIDTDVPVVEFTTPQTLTILEPRQAVDVHVIEDDFTAYEPGDIIELNDLFNSPGVENPGGAPRWVIEQVEVEPDDDLILLSCFRKELARP